MGIESLRSFNILCFVLLDWFYIWFTNLIVDLCMALPFCFVILWLLSWIYLFLLMPCFPLDLPFVLHALGLGGLGNIHWVWYRSHKDLVRDSRRPYTWIKSMNKNEKGWAWAIGQERPLLVYVGASFLNMIASKNEIMYKLNIVFVNNKNSTRSSLKL